MLGYDLTWADFNIIEVMSSPKYHLKTVGYLGASQSFNQHTDVLMLATNLLKKVCVIDTPDHKCLNRCTGPLFQPWGYRLGIKWTFYLRYARPCTRLDTRTERNAKSFKS
jgi:hypothetical protein